MAYETEIQLQYRITNTNLDPQLFLGTMASIYNLNKIHQLKKTQAPKQYYLFLNQHHFHVK